LLNELRTTIVIPLCLKSVTGTAVISKLCPIFEIDNKDFVALTQQMAGIDRKVLGKEIGDLSHYRSEIIASLDFIISGI
jgi:toxin CcdB